MPLAAYEKRHRLSCFQRYFEALLRLLNPDFEEAATPLKSEAEAAPTRRQVGIESYAVAAHRQPRETEHGRQPDPAQGRYVQATVDRDMAVREIDRRSLPKVPECHFGITQPSRGDAVHGAAQRTAVAAARLVVVEVRYPGLTNELLRQQREERHHISLFDHLGSLRPLPPKHHVHWHGSACVVRQIDLFEPEIARELLEQSRPGIEAARHRLRDLVPLLQFSDVQAEAG